MLKFEEPVRMQVFHPEKGMLEVLAYCIVDAKMQASAAWELSQEEYEKLKVAVHNSALAACSGLVRT